MRAKSKKSGTCPPRSPSHPAPVHNHPDDSPSGPCANLIASSAHQLLPSMLQRLVFGQKRHWEQCSVLSKSLLIHQYHPQPAPARPPRPFLPPPSDPESSASPAHPLAEHFASLSANFDRPVTQNSTQQLLHHIRSQPSLVDLFTTGKRINAFAQHLAKSRTPSYASRVLLLAQEMGCPLKPDAYEAVCFHVAASHKWDLILETVDLAKAYLGKLTIRLLHWRARAFLETRQLPRLIHILEDFRDEGHRPTRRTFHFILSGYLRNHDLAGAKLCIETMQGLGHPPDATTFSLISDQYRPFGSDYNLKVSALASLPDLPPHVATRVLNNLIQLSMDTEDDASIRHFLRFFHPRAVSHFKLPLAHDRKPKDKLPQRVELFLLPDSDTFALFIRYAAKKGNHAAAFAFLQRMVQFELPATVDVIVSLLFACFTAGCRQDAFHLFSSLCENAHVPRAYYAPFVSSPSQPTLDLSFLDTSDIPLTTRICNMMLKYCHSQFDLTHAILQITVDRHLQWSSSTIDILLSHLKAADPTQAERLMDFVLEHASSSTVDTNHLHKIYSAILTEEKRSRLSGPWKRPILPNAQRTPVPNLPLTPPNPPQLPTFSGTSAVEDPMAGLQAPQLPPSRFDKASRIESLLPARLLSDAAIISLRLRRDAVLRQDMTTAEQVFQTLLKRGIHPNEYHYTALIEGYVGIGDFTSAIATMEKAKAAGIQPTVVMYTILICGYGKRKELNKAVLTWRRMIAQGIQPDFAAVDAIVGAHFAVGWERRAKALLLSLWRKIQKIPKSYKRMKLSWLIRKFRRLEKDVMESTGKGVMSLAQRDALQAVVREQRRTSLPTFARKRPLVFSFSKRRRRRAQTRFTIRRRHPRSKSGISR